MNINNSQFLSNLQIQEAIFGNQSVKETKNVPRLNEDHRSFNEILNEKIEDNVNDVRFSKHAMTRLENRNITISQSQMERLNDAARKAGEKGIRESLVLVDELAFIVNVEHNTVVTAMDQGTNEENIFTNIDGAVIA
ncbi:MAG: flagellar protein [Lachnospiraceae bacterium]|nr:flagellar protein [Lachnospiraceae bacterium]